MPALRLVRPFRRLTGALVVASLVLVAACGTGQRQPTDTRPGAPGLQRDQRNISFDPAPLYRQMGLIARGLPFPVVGRVGYLAAAAPDTTHVVLALSFSATSLSFVREADNRFRANYTVSLAFDRNGERVETIEATESVIVSSYRETGRSDENLLFQQIVDLAPGPYQLSVAIRDAGSDRSTAERVEMFVPSFGTGGATLSTPVPINQVTPRIQRDSLPFLLLRPRATVTFGRDSTLALYIESYGRGDESLRLLARNETGTVLWTDDVRITPFQEMASGVVEVPITRLGIGVSQLSFVRANAVDTSSTYVFVGFGEDLPIARFDDMLVFLRYFATPARLQRLRETPEAERPAAWASFMQETDSTPQTPAHEDLNAYFARLVRANTRYREEAIAGWMSDRGKVFIVLGEPDFILEPTVTDFNRNRQQLWEYRDRGLSLVFFDETGTGRWRLTQSSEVRFETEFRRRLR